MLLIDLKNIEKYYGDRLLFKIDSLSVFSGDRIGIIGDNGAGKTTLLNILTGNLKPDFGRIEIKGEISYVTQLSEENSTPDSKQASIFNIKGNIHSGGEIMRRKIAAAFSKPFEILALDEPTANLDLKGIEILKNKLETVETLLLISHDRNLLDSACNKILDIKNGKVTLFNGSYSEYAEIVINNRKRQEDIYEEYIREKSRLESSARERSEKSKSIKKAPSRMGNSEARLHKREANVSRAKIDSAGKNLIKRIEMLEKAERPKEIRFIKPDFKLTNPPQNKIIFSCENLNFAYGENIIFSEAKFNIPSGSHTAILGDNGSGKTTLIKLLAEENDIIYKVPKAKIGYMAQDFIGLDFSGTILSNISETAVQSQTVCRNVLANMGFYSEDVYKKINMLSGGEIVKAMLSKLIVSDCNVLILDEPTNYLDINSINQVQEALKNYEGTLIFVSHDIGFVEEVASAKLKIENKKIIKVL